MSTGGPTNPPSVANPLDEETLKQNFNAKPKYTPAIEVFNDHLHDDHVDLPTWHPDYQPNPAEFKYREQPMVSDTLYYQGYDDDDFSAEEIDKEYGIERNITFAKDAQRDGSVFDGIDIEAALARQSRWNKPDDEWVDDDSEYDPYWKEKAELVKSAQEFELTMKEINDAVDSQREERHRREREEQQRERQRGPDTMKNPFFHVQKAYEETQSLLPRGNEQEMNTDDDPHYFSYQNVYERTKRAKLGGKQKSTLPYDPLFGGKLPVTIHDINVEHIDSDSLSEELHNVEQAERGHYAKRWNQGALQGRDFIQSQFYEDVDTDYESKMKNMKTSRYVLNTIVPDDPPQIKRERELWEKKERDRAQINTYNALPAFSGADLQHTTKHGKNDTKTRKSHHTDSDYDYYQRGWSDIDLYNVESDPNFNTTLNARQNRQNPYDFNDTTTDSSYWESSSTSSSRSSRGEYGRRYDPYDEFDQSGYDGLDFDNNRDKSPPRSRSRSTDVQPTNMQLEAQVRRDKLPKKDLWEEAVQSTVFNLNRQDHASVEHFMRSLRPEKEVSAEDNAKQGRFAWRNEPLTPLTMHLQDPNDVQVDSDTDLLQMVDIWVLHGKTVKEAKELIVKNKYPTSVPYTIDPFIRLQDAWEVETTRLDTIQTAKKLEMAQQREAEKQAKTSFPRTKPRHVAEKMYFNLHKMVLKSQLVHPDYYKYLSDDTGFLEQIQHSFYHWLWRYLYPEGKRLQYRLHAYPKRNGPLVLPAKKKKRRNKQGIRVAHLTDLHYFDYNYTPTFAEMMSKRLWGYINLLLLGRDEHFSAEARSDIIRKIDEMDPDLIICTGDLTSTGLEHEFEIAFAELEPLIKKYPFFVIPGNHDVYTPETEQKMPMYRRFLEHMHKIVPFHIFRHFDEDTLTDGDDWVKSLNNYQSLRVDEIEKMREIRIQMKKDEERKNRYYVDENGELQDRMLSSRALMTTDANLLDTDIQGQYPSLSLFLTKPITRLNIERDGSSHQEGKFLNTITNAQLQQVAQQSFAHLPPRQLVYTQRDIDNLDISAFIPQYPFPHAPQFNMDTPSGQALAKMTPPWYQMHNKELLNKMMEEYQPPEEYLDPNYNYALDAYLEERHRQNQIDIAGQFPPENYPTTPNNNQVLVIGLNPCRATGIGSQGNYPREQLEDLQRFLNNRKHIMNNKHAELTASEPLDDSTIPFIILATHYPVIDRTGYDYSEVHKFHGVHNNHQLLHILDTAQVKPGLIIHGHDHLGSATGIATQRNLAHNATNDYLYPSFPPNVNRPLAPPFNYDTDPTHLYCENNPQLNIYAPHNNKKSPFERIWEVLQTKYKIAKWYSRELFSPSRTRNILNGHVDSLQQEDIDLLNKAWDDPSEYDFTLDSSKKSSQETFDPDLPRLLALFEADMAYTPTINDVLNAYSGVYSMNQMDSIDVALTLDELQLAQVNNARDIILSANQIKLLDPEVTREYIEEYNIYKSESEEIIKSQIGSYCHTTVPLDLQSYLSGTLQPFTLVKPPIFDPEHNLHGFFGNGLVRTIRKRIENVNSSWLGSGTSTFVSSLRPQLQRISNSAWYKRVYDYVSSTPSLYAGVAVKESVSQFFAKKQQGGLLSMTGANDSINASAFDPFDTSTPSIFHDEFDFYHHGTKQSYRNGEWDGISRDAIGNDFPLFHGSEYSANDILNYMATLTGQTFAPMLHDNFQEKDLIARHIDHNPGADFATAFNKGISADKMKELHQHEYFSRPDAIDRDLPSQKMGHISTEIHRRKVSDLNRLELQLREIRHSLDRYENQYKNFVENVQSSPYLPKNIKTVNTVYGDMTYSPEFTQMLRERMVKDNVTIEDLRRRYNQTADLIDMLRMQPRGLLEQDWPDITKHASKEDFEKTRAAISHEDARPLIPLLDATKQLSRQVLNIRLRWNIIKIVRNTWLPTFLQRNTQQADELLDGVFWPFALENNLDRPWFDPMFVEFHRNRRLIDIPDRGKWEIPVYGLETLAPKWRNPAFKGMKVDDEFHDEIPFFQDPDIDLYRHQSSLIERAKELFKEQRWWDNYTIFREGVTRPAPGYENYTISPIIPGSLTAQLLDPKYKDSIPPTPYDLRGYNMDEHAYTYSLYRPRLYGDMVSDGSSMAHVYQNKVPEHVLKKMGLAKELEPLPFPHIDDLGDLDIRSVMKDRGDTDGEFGDHGGSNISDSVKAKLSGLRDSTKTFQPDDKDPFKVLSYQEMLAQSTENTHKYNERLQKQTKSVYPGLGLIDDIKLGAIKNTSINDQYNLGGKYGLDSGGYRDQIANTDRLVAEIAEGYDLMDSQNLPRRFKTDLLKQGEERPVEIKSGLYIDRNDGSANFAPVIFTGSKDTKLLGSLEHQFPHGLRRYRELTELVSTQQLFDDWIKYTGAGIVDTSISAQIPVGQTVDYLTNKFFYPISRGVVHHDQAKVFLHAACRHVENLRIAALEELENEEAVMKYRQTLLMDKIKNEGYEDRNDYLQQIEESFKYYEASRILVNQRVASFIQLANKWNLYIDRIPSYIQVEQLKATREDQLAMLYDEAYALGVTLDLVEKQFPWMKRTLSKTHPLSNRFLSLKPGQMTSSDPQIAAVREKKLKYATEQINGYGVNVPFQAQERLGSSLGAVAQHFIATTGKSTPEERHHHLSSVTEHLRPLIAQHLDDKPSFLFSEALSIIDNQVIDQYGRITDPASLSPTIVQHMIDEVSNLIQLQKKREEKERQYQRSYLKSSSSSPPVSEALTLQQRFKQSALEREAKLLELLEEHSTLNQIYHRLPIIPLSQRSDPRLSTPEGPITPPKVVIPIHNPGSAAMAPLPPKTPKDYPKLAAFNMYTVIPRNEIEQRLIFASTLWHQNEIKFPNNGNSFVSGDYYALEFQHFLHLGHDVVESEVPYTYPLF